MRKKDYSLKDYLIHGIYFFFYGFVKYFPPPIGNMLRYFVSKLFVKKMGFCRIAEGVSLWYPYRILIGNHVTINEFAYLSGYGGLIIEDHVRIGARAIFLTSDHNFSRRDLLIKDQGLISGEIVVKRDVLIGCNVTILKGVTVGEGAIIGAGSIVTKDIPPFSIVAGVPAKVLRYRK